MGSNKKIMCCECTLYTDKCCLLPDAPPHSPQDLAFCEYPVSCLHFTDSWQNLHRLRAVGLTSHPPFLLQPDSHLLPLKMHRHAEHGTAPARGPCLRQIWQLPPVIGRTFIILRKILTSKKSQTGSVSCRAYSLLLGK